VNANPATADVWRLAGKEVNHDSMPW
jgi:hypothetical protein